MFICRKYLFIISKHETKIMTFIGRFQKRIKFYKLMEDQTVAFCGEHR